MLARGLCWRDRRQLVLSLETEVLADAIWVLSTYPASVRRAVQTQHLPLPAMSHCLAEAREARWVPRCPALWLGWAGTHGHGILSLLC